MIDRRAPLSKADPAIYALIRREVERQEHGLELIASENFATMAVMEAMGSALTNKYAEGLPKKRYYGGCEVVDEVEQLAIDRAKALFKAEHVNVQPHSGAQANMAAYLAVAKPGAALLGLALSHGGHLTHGSPVNFSGTLFRASSYGVREETGRIDYDQVREIARRERPRILVGGGSAYARIIDFAALRSVADEVGAILVVDMAHFAGLVAAARAGLGTGRGRPHPPLRGGGRAAKPPPGEGGAGAARPRGHPGEKNPPPGPPAVALGGGGRPQGPPRRDDARLHGAGDAQGR